MRLVPGVHLVASGALGFGMTHALDCNVYAIDGGSEFALIDCGAGLDVDAILATLREDGLAPRKVSFILLTHKHADHVGGAKRLRDRLGCAILASAHTAEVLQAGDEARISLDVAKRSGAYPAAYRLEACPVDAIVYPGQVLQVGGLRLDVLDTPGHCEGHVAYLLEGDGVRLLFSGDALLFGGRIVLQDTYDCDLRLQMDTLRHLAEIPFEGLLAGHLTPVLRGGRAHLDKALARMRQGLAPLALEP